MERARQIEIIVEFVNRHPESLVSRVIKRETAVPDAEFAEEPQDSLRLRLEAAAADRIDDYYYLVR